MWQGVDLERVRTWARADWLRADGSRSGDRARAVTGVSTDSRRVRSGEVFVALAGARHDGHDHVEAAWARGAVAAVVCRQFAERRAGGRAATRQALSGGVLLAVDSPLAALGRLARHYRRRFDIPVVAITGSAGKTTAKEMAAAVLGRRFRVLKTPANENNEIGVPRAVLGLTPEHEAAVFELAARRVGDIACLCRIVQPTIGVLLNIGTAHLEVFGSVERVAKAKGELLDSIVDESCVALVNADDRVVAGEAMRTKGRLLGFGWRRESHVSGEGFVLDQEGCGHFSLQNTSFHLRIPGRHNADNALAAVAVGSLCGVPLVDASAALADVGPVAMRSELLRKRGIRVINDCYNANPVSVRAAIDMMAAMRVDGRRIAVFGDMLELGPQASRLHEEVGRYATGRVDILLGTGPLGAHFVDGARAAGMDTAAARHFDDRDSLARHLHAVADAGDLVLVKASRGVALEDLIERL